MIKFKQLKNTLSLWCKNRVSIIIKYVRSFLRRYLCRYKAMYTNNMLHSKIKMVFAMLFIIAAVVSFLYWTSCLLFAGAGIADMWIWPVASVFFIVCFLWISGRPPFTRLNRNIWLRTTATILLILLFIFFITIECFVISGMNEDGEADLEYIIVLGAQVRGTYPSSALKWRIDRAYEYLNENPKTKAVVSGGQGSGEDISEAECMRRELLSRGISDERILIEDKSTSTKENITFSIQIIGTKDAEVGVVTNNFHVWRATKIAHRAGLPNTVGISAPFDNLLIFHYMVREFFSIVMNTYNGNM